MTARCRKPDIPGYKIPDNRSDQCGKNQRDKNIGSSLLYLLSLYRWLLLSLLKRKPVLWITYGSHTDRSYRRQYFGGDDCWYRIGWVVKPFMKSKNKASIMVNIMNSCKITKYRLLAIFYNNIAYDVAASSHLSSRELKTFVYLFSFMISIASVPLKRSATDLL